MKEEVICRMKKHFSVYGTSRKFIKWANSSHGAELTESSVSRALTGVGSKWTWLVFKIYLDEVESQTVECIGTQKQLKG